MSKNNLYDVQNWNNYDYEQSLQTNIKKNAVVTEENMNHIEEGILKANRPIEVQISRTGTQFNAEVIELEDKTVLLITAPNVKTDKGLELEDVPADAKSTGMEIDGLLNQITSLSNRINNITKLEQGSTTGDAELQDIRITFDGMVYNTAGDAIRAQISKLHGLYRSILSLMHKGLGTVVIASDNDYEPLETI